MRRMYSEQELTKVIGDVVDSKIEDGSFDESIADYIDEYLVEHPVDITALEGKTIAPAIVNATTSMSAPYFTGVTYLESIKDADGHNRFVKGAGLIHGNITELFNEWSLSGSHLMLVCAGSVAGDDSIAQSFVFAEYALPQWILDKIVPLLGQNYVDVALPFRLYDGTTPVSSYLFHVRKVGSNIQFQNAHAMTVPSNKTYTFRLEFDLLID